MIPLNRKRFGTESNLIYRIESSLPMKLLDPLAPLPLGQRQRRALPCRDSLTIPLVRALRFLLEGVRFHLTSRPKGRLAWRCLPPAR